MEAFTSAGNWPPLPGPPAICSSAVIKSLIETLPSISLVDIWIPMPSSFFKTLQTTSRSIVTWFLSGSLCFIWLLISFNFMINFFRSNPPLSSLAKLKAWSSSFGDRPKSLNNDSRWGIAEISRATGWYDFFSAGSSSVSLLKNRDRLISPLGLFSASPCKNLSTLSWEKPQW